MTNSMDRGPVFLQPRFVCPHPSCGAFAQQAWDVVLRRGQTGTEPLQVDLQAAERVNSWEQAARWYAAECGSCEQMSLWLDEVMVYPSTDRLGPLPHVDLPADVRELHSEAAEVAARSRRAGAALARASMERLLRHLDPTAPKSANLEKRIELIRPKVSSHLGDLLHVIRVTANGAVHVDDQPDAIVVLMLDDEEGPALVELMLDAVNQLADELITRPRRAGELFAQLPPNVRGKYKATGSPTP